MTYKYGDSLPSPAVRPPVPPPHKITQALAYSGAYSAPRINQLIIGIGVVGFKVLRGGRARRAVSLGGSRPRPFGSVGQWDRDEQYGRVVVCREEYEMAIEGL